MKDLSKNSAMFVTVAEDGAGQRIDNYLLKHLKGVPKSHIYRILRSGEVRLNKGRVAADRRLALGDSIRLPPLHVPEKPPQAHVPAANFKLVYDDPALMVIDKPADLAVHGGSGVNFGVIEQLRQTYPAERYLELAHRLDRGTSGLLIIGKQRAALLRLHQMFRDGTIGKRYLTLVKGGWRDQLRHVKLPLLEFRTAQQEKRVRVAPQGKAAHSLVRLKQRLRLPMGDFSLLEVELRTGRTHQIRVHLAHLGFPIAGDDKYGDFELNRRLQQLGLKRMFLHAASMRLTHPLTQEVLHLKALLPPDLSDFLNTTEQNCDEKS